MQRGSHTGGCTRSMICLDGLHRIALERCGGGHRQFQVAWYGVFQNSVQNSWTLECATYQSSTLMCISPVTLLLLCCYFAGHSHPHLPAARACALLRDASDPAPPGASGRRGPWQQGADVFLCWEDLRGSEQAVGDRQEGGKGEGWIRVGAY